MKTLLALLIAAGLVALGAGAQAYHREVVLWTARWKPPWVVGNPELLRIAVALEGIDQSLKSIARTGVTTPVRLRFDQCVTVLTNEPKAVKPATEEVE